MDPERAEDYGGSAKVISPFAQTKASVPQNPKSGVKLALIIAFCLALVAGGAVAGMSILHYVNDPYRTLEIFPVSAYLENYEGLAGSRFKADFRVEADLGWKDGVGRLMLFSTAEEPRPIAVLIPPAVANGIYFTKGQTYLAEIEVKEGGLIYANSCRKD